MRLNLSQVRHGQYDEQRDLYRPLAKNDRDFGMPHDEAFLEVDAKQVLTDLGRRQAEATGVKLREMLGPALETPGRESHVRIHVSSLTRAKETADIIAKHLPGHIRRLPPDPNLAEGWPLAHRIPFPQGAPEDESRMVHVEGARIEAAFRSLFYRGRPGTPPPPSPPTDPAASAAAISGSAPYTPPPHAPAPMAPAKKLPKHEYDIVVCHGNVIRCAWMGAAPFDPSTPRPHCCHAVLLLRLWVPRLPLAYPQRSWIDSQILRCVRCSWWVMKPISLETPCLLHCAHAHTHTRSHMLTLRTSSSALTSSAGRRLV